MVKRILKICLSVFISLGIFLSVYAFTVIAHTPKINPDNIYDFLSEKSVLLDDEGNMIDSVYLDGGNRTNIKFKDIPKDLIDAIVSIEDKTFWSHNGFNIIRMFGAIKDSLTSGGSIGGTSTITQQLARNVYLPDTKSVRSLNRKISEAYYTVILENTLSKEQIIEAYLNTIYLGNNAYGVQSAARYYFNKEAKDLDLLECASLAALPKSPNNFALIQKFNSSDAVNIDKSKKILHEDIDYTFVYNGDVSKPRRDTTLKFMLQNKYISQEEYDTAMAENLEDKLDITANITPDAATYFVDYLIDEVTKDLIDKYGYSPKEALDKIYTGGLTIHTTMNSKAQNAINKTFSNPYNFPALMNIRYDREKNIIDDNGNPILIPYDSYFDEDEQIILNSDEYIEKDGNLVLLKDKRLKFYNTTVGGKTDYSIDLKDIYKFNNGVLYTMQGGTILIPQQYKSLDSEGNLIIDKSFFNDKSIHTEGSSFLLKNGDSYTIGKSHIKLRSLVRQPQAAMVITDYTNGHLKAMSGGRETKGKKLFNRAIKPRQPGSTIKPIAVYTPALQLGKNAADNNTPMKFYEFDDKQKTSNYGDYWTAASGINDAPIKFKGKDWPKNWYEEYRGLMSMRKALELSVNTTSVRVYQQVGDDYSIGMLKKFGISTVVEDGENNDKNASALAMGGMLYGISPLEMTSAYGVFPNGGDRYDTIAYTKVTDKQGKVILEKTADKHDVIDRGVAFIMQDMLLSNVQRGLATQAQGSGQPTAGKTGTTSESYDIWFAGFTPQYAATVWIGSDFNLTVNPMSGAPQIIWAKVMREATAGMGGALLQRPDNVIHHNGEYFIKGTEKGVRFSGDKDEDEDKDKEDENEGDEEVEETDTPTTETTPSSPTQPPSQPQTNPPATP